MATRSMSKLDMVETIANRANLPRKQAQMALEIIVELIKGQIVAGKDLRVSGLGTFYRYESRARIGRHPLSGEPIAIPRRARMGFKSGQQVRQMLNPDAKKNRGC